MDVTGATSLSSTLSVYNNTQILGGDLTVNGNLNLAHSGGNRDVTFLDNKISMTVGESIMVLQEDSFTITDAPITSNKPIRTTEDMFARSFKVNGGDNALTPSQDDDYFSVTSSEVRSSVPFFSEKSATLSSTLNVTGATTLSDTLNVTKSTTLSSTLNVTGATTLSDTLNVTKSTTLSSTLDVTKAATLSDTLNVTGATTLSSTLEVTGATTLSSTLNVIGTTTLNSVNITSNFKYAIT